jgi:hypothetical protein
MLGAAFPTEEVDMAERAPFEQQPPSDARRGLVSEERLARVGETNQDCSSDDMRGQIAEAAYYLAEQRGFAPGCDGRLARGGGTDPGPPQRCPELTKAARAVGEVSRNAAWKLRRVSSWHRPNLSIGETRISEGDAQAITTRSGMSVLCCAAR